MLAQAIGLFTTFATVGGGLWAVWGVVTLAGGLKDHNGPQTQDGMWQLIGGAMIVAAAQLFSTIDLSGVGG
ncbi:MAG: hypothetical protein Q4C87_06535 [Actinomycetaceae bacterium]|nr:hypothetical protein [Actinomycetaceae bacterium]